MTTDKTKNFFRVSAKNLKKIPGSPIAYWLSERLLATFEYPKIGDRGTTRNGMTTGDNNRFLRYWFEVNIKKTSFNAHDAKTALSSQKKWFPYNKGGECRRWYGNFDYVINWETDGKELKDFPNSILRNQTFYFKSSITWSLTNSSHFGARIRPVGSIFDVNGMSLFVEPFYFTLGLLNSYIASCIIKVLNPTISNQAGDIDKIPISANSSILSVVDETAREAVNNTKSDWDSYETSWDFQTNPLLTVGNRLNSGGNQFDLSAIYIALRRDWQRQTEEMRRLEIENNRIFIDAYDLQDELSPEVPWNEITLTCNPWYRYGKNIENFDAVCNDFVLGKKERIEILPVNNNESDERSAEAFPFSKETEERLLEDTIKEFISYAVGCMMGRYSPEKSGLILANQGESFDDYASTLAGIKIHFQRESIPLNSPENFAKVREYLKDATWYGAVTDESGEKYSLIADRDGVIPILDEEWFVDDIVAQFKQFLRFTFGEEYFADNLDFIEKALGKDLRKYFIKDFYKDHVQRYKKRPIYWMFSSPKGSFNALIYMHRYRPDTVSIVLNEYLREFISKIRAKREHLIGDNNRTTLSPAEKTRNLKQIDKYAAMLTELDAYERDILYPLAQEKIAIDLDDGVKVNYVKFGAALKKIPGLEAKEE